MFALAAWLVIYGLFLTRRLLGPITGSSAFSMTPVRTTSVPISNGFPFFTYWAVTFGVGCGLLTFLPDEYVYIWILSSVPFYIYLFLCYLNYLLFYEQVENAMEDGMTSEEEDLCDTTNREQAQRQDTPFFPCRNGEKNQRLYRCGRLYPARPYHKGAFRCASHQPYLPVRVHQTTYDMSFRDWIIGLRIEYAKRLLARYPRLTVADISENPVFVTKPFYKAVQGKCGLYP